MSLLKHRSTRFYLVFFVILVMAIGGSVAAFADSGTATVAVKTGTLTMSGVTNVTAAPVTLTGDDQTTTYSMGLAVTDATGSGAGWKLTITSTTFTSGSNTLDTAASSILTAPAVSCVGTGNHCTNPTDSVTYPLAGGVPAGSSAPAPVIFFNATANSGLGKFTITPTVTIAIPGNAYAGTYTSTVTIALASGPS